MKLSLLSALGLSLGLTSISYGGNSIWKLDPTSSDWNTADNWIPANIPNAPNDVAIFGNSNLTDISVSASSVQVKEIIFDSSATSSFNITCIPQSSDRNQIFVISGTGLTNNSAFPQSLTSGPSANSREPKIKFMNAASAGSNTVLNAYRESGIDFHDHSSAGSASLHAYGSDGGLDSGGGGFGFYNHSTAGNASFTIHPGTRRYANGGGVGFLAHATADHATFVVEAPTTENFYAGEVGFLGESSAGDAVITLVGPMTNSSPQVSFTDAATAGNAVITANGGQKSGAFGGYVTFSGYAFTGLTTTAGHATLIINGGNGAGSYGAHIFFSNASTAGEARLVANGGTNGGPAGHIDFDFGSDGGAAQVEVYDDGYLDLSFHDGPGITIGSLAGTGFVYTGSNNLTIGSNNFSTTFSGTIQEDGGIANGSNGTMTKIGTGTLTLDGASTYAGGTTLSDGVLKVNNAAGSGTGTGLVQVDAGTLGGRGIIAGAVTVGTGSGAGAFLQPGRGASSGNTLTIQKTLTFKSDGSYSWKLNTNKANADQVVANGVTIEPGAQFVLTPVGDIHLTEGTVFTAISNTSATAISASFANLSDGSTVTVGSNSYQVSYSGGDGNDLTLTVVP